MEKNQEKIIFQKLAKNSEMSVAFNNDLKTVFESAMDPVSQLQPFNSDDLYQRDGDYRAYEEMLQDDQVSVCSALKKDLILGGGWEITIADEDQIEIKEELECMLKDELKVSFDEQIKEVLTAYDFGFSVTEKLFEMRDGKVALKELKTRNPVTWLLHQDEFGDVVRYEQRGLNASSDIPEEALIHYINNRRFSNPYGISDLRAAYTAFFIKKNITRYLAIYLEKAASPIPIAKYAPGTPNETVQDVFDIIKKFQNKTAMAIPKDFEVEFLESKTNGDAYHMAINLMNMFIARSMFVPDLAGFGGSETQGGSYSLGEHQLNIFFNHINHRRETLERTINQHIITPIVLNNYGELDSYPKFKFLPVDDKEAVDLAKTWLEAVKGKVFKPTDEEVNHFRKLTKFPESDEVEIPGDDPQPPEDPRLEPKPTGEAPEDMEEAEEEEKEEFSRKSRVNTKLVKSLMDSTEMSIIDETKPLFDSIIDDYTSKIQKKKIVEKEDLELLEKIKVKQSARLKQILTRNMKDAFKSGSRLAKTEIRADFAVSNDFDEDFLKFIDQENVNYINDWEYNFTRNARNHIVEAIKDGRPVSAAIAEIKRDAEKLTKESIERYARTKTTEVLNKGRMATFESSGMVQGYEYSAIIDGRVTAICRGLHKKQFKKGSEPIPPLHWNCRSLILPVLLTDDLNPADKIGDKSVDKFINDNKGKGFSKR